MSGDGVFMSEELPEKRDCCQEEADQEYGEQKKIILPTQLRLIEGNQCAVEAAQDHGLVDPFGAVPAFYQSHAEEVAVGTIGVYGICWDKSPQSGRPLQPQIFLVNDKELAIRKEEEKGELAWHAKSLQPMAQTSYRGGGEQGQKTEKNPVGLQADEGRHPDTVQAHIQEKKGDNLVSSVSEGKGEPEKEGEDVDTAEPFQEKSGAGSGQAEQYTGQDTACSCNQKRGGQGKDQGDDNSRNDFYPGVASVKKSSASGKGFFNHCFCCPLGRRFLSQAASPARPKR